MTLPTTLKVGAYTYRVKATDAPDVYGSTDNEQMKIRVAGWLCEQQQRATLLHEALHAMLHDAGAEKVLGLDYEAEEKLVSLIEPRLFDLILHNPDLIAYLLAP